MQFAKLVPQSLAIYAEAIACLAEMSVRMLQHARDEFAFDGSYNAVIQVLVVPPQHRVDACRDVQFARRRPDRHDVGHVADEQARW